MKAPKHELVTRFGLDECVEFEPRYNIAPSTGIPTIIQTPEGKRVLQLMHWGLIPGWAKDASIGNRLINARGESIAEKPSFSASFKRRRCLIPASGFYEWAQEGKVKQPYYISLKSGEVMALAGLWETWRTPDGSSLQSACIVTTGANELMRPIHDRMPVIVEPGNWQDWLTAVQDDADKLIRPYESDDLLFWAVSRKVNKPSEEGPSLIGQNSR